jgi:threonyl-tRNA synthetase
MRKVPYMLVVGGNEETDGTVSVRDRTGVQHPVLTLAEFETWLSDRVRQKVVV